jgi:hypothetical protein
MRCVALCLAWCGIAALSPCWAADVPDWLRAQVSAPLPAHDDKTNAVALYSETVLTAQADGRLKVRERGAYRILRPDGENLGLLRVTFDAQSRITAIHGWSIPAEGKVFEVKEKNAIESAVYGVDDSILISDVQTKLLQIPAAQPGNVIGYEYEQELAPDLWGHVWDFQDSVPVREAHYTLQLPPGWGYKSVWINSPPSEPVAAGNGRWSWTISNIEAVRPERDMPPWRGIARRMAISLVPPGAQSQAISSWGDLGAWYYSLARDRRTATPEIQAKVNALTANAPTLLEKMQALAAFVQNDIRYVAIELGIGGHQPHPARDVFINRYGDCKDKSTLLAAMLKQLGVESYAVAINTTRGSISAATPPYLGFDHMILAIVLPDDLKDPSLQATLRLEKYGRLLFFDPTDDLTPFGAIPGGLQANVGLLAAPEGGELVELPQLSGEANGLHRTARMILDAKGVLRGDIHETRTGDAAAAQRYALRSSTLDTDRIKPVEALAAASLANYRILKATITNLHETREPFEWNYSLEAENYAKATGGLMMVRPRVLGSKSSGLLETDEARRYPVEFDGPRRDTDEFEIALPAGFEVDDLPPPVNADYGFAIYESRTTVVDRALHYSRSFEIRQLSVPLGNVGKLKELYRVIADDERQLAILKPAGT